MVLKATYADITDIPEQFQELFSERGGKYELTGVAGVKTQDDVARVQSALEKERNEHKGTKDKFSAWGDLDHAEIMSKLDRIPELEMAAKGKLDENELEELVARRYDARINQVVAPKDRELTKLQSDYAAAQEKIQTFELMETRRTIHDDLRSAMTESKVIPEAQDDALMLAERMFEIREDGQVVTRDGVGVTPGIPSQVWLQEMQAKRPHWWPVSGGSGATPGKSGGLGMGGNPWSKDSWNMTEQNAFTNTHGREKAAQMAQSAGTKLNGLKPK